MDLSMFVECTLKLCFVMCSPRIRGKLVCHALSANHTVWSRSACVYQAYTACESIQIASVVSKWCTFNWSFNFGIRLKLQGPNHWKHIPTSICFQNWNFIWKDDHLNIVEAVQTESQAVLATFMELNFQKSFAEWKKHLYWCIRVGGNYSEGDSSQDV